MGTKLESYIKEIKNFLEENYVCYELCVLMWEMMSCFNCLLKSDAKIKSFSC